MLQARVRQLLQEIPSKRIEALSRNGLIHKWVLLDPKYAMCFVGMHVTGRLLSLLSFLKDALYSF